MNNMSGAFDDGRVGASRKKTPEELAQEVFVSIKYL